MARKSGKNRINYQQNRN